MKENLFETIEKHTKSYMFNRRHKAEAGNITVGKTKYTVISVLPFTDENYIPDTAENKLMYLVNGK